MKPYWIPFLCILALLVFNTKAKATDTIKVYHTSEAYLNAKPDTTLYCERSPEITIKTWRKTDERELRIKNRICQTTLNLNSGFLIVENQGKTFRMMPDGSLAILRICDGLCLFSYKDILDSYVYFLEDGYMLYLMDEGKWWFSNSPVEPVQRLTRNQLRETFTNNSQFLAALDKNFGRTENGLRAKCLSRRKKGEYVLLKLYKEYILGIN